MAVAEINPCWAAISSTGGWETRAKELLTSGARGVSQADSSAPSEEIPVGSEEIPVGSSRPQWRLQVEKQSARDAERVVQLHLVFQPVCCKCIIPSPH